MKHSTLTSSTVKSDKVNNLILNFPDEMLTADWKLLQTYLPGDMFLDAVFHWIFSDKEDSLQDLLQVAIDELPEPQESDGSVNATWPDMNDEVLTALILKLAEQMYDIFSVFLKTILPKPFEDARYVERVIYDPENQDIYLMLSPDEDDYPIATATDLIDSENEEEDSDESDDDEVEDEDLTGDD